MDLFDSIITPPVNLLPKDGVAEYYGTVFSEYEAENYFSQLLSNINWQHDKSVIAGKTIITKRKVAWHGEKPFQYTYSGTTKQALPWTETLQEIKQIIEKRTNERYNACLLNLYHSGLEGMSWHSDNEKDLKKEAAIASISFGAVRKFSFKHKQSKDVISLQLENGSLLVMKGSTQKHWLHALPPSKKVTLPRINLTFRTIIE